MTQYTVDKIAGVLKVVLVMLGAMGTSAVFVYGLGQKASDANGKLEQGVKRVEALEARVAGVEGEARGIGDRLTRIETDVRWIRGAMERPRGLGNGGQP